MVSRIEISMSSVTLTFKIAGFMNVSYLVPTVGWRHRIRSREALDGSDAVYSAHIAVMIDPPMPAARKAAGIGPGRPTSTEITASRFAPSVLMRYILLMGAPVAPPLVIYIIEKG